METEGFEERGDRKGVNEPRKKPKIKGKTWKDANLLVVDCVLSKVESGLTSIFTSKMRFGWEEKGQLPLKLNHETHGGKIGTLMVNGEWKRQEGEMINRGKFG